ncbi:glycosyltransferase family 2 protein [Parasphingorhabdus sp.]|uniref:glycosyltransferase family 2 protein n=1 Tax=Parasphingorhabdus sp. TaxID=2709688 RepID=UPI003D279E5E
MISNNLTLTLKAENCSDTEPRPENSDWTTIAAVPGLVSIIIPTFNRIALLTELLASICAQSWQEIEIIVVDDGSVDNTNEQLKNWSPTGAGRSFSLFPQTNAGPAAARNAGIRKSRGEFVYFIDSDDLIYPHAISTLVQSLQNSEDHYCLANIQTVHIQSGSTDIIYGEIVRPQLGEPLESSWMTHAALYRRSAIAAGGVFNETLEIAEDIEFQWRVSQVNGNGGKIESTIGVRRQHPFGHLSVGRSQTSLNRHLLQALMSFHDWAVANDRMTSTLRRHLLRRFLAAGIKLGSSGAWQHKNQAFSMFAEISKTSNIWTKILIYSGSLNARAYFKLLVIMVKLTKLLKAVKGRWIPLSNS